jgi:hypothetical protein
MKRIVVSALVGIGIFAAGCESLRFAPGEAQRQNAWLHNRTTQVTAETASREAASDKLQALTKLSERQSRAFVSYCGLPDKFPKAETAEEILTEANYHLADTAIVEASVRPDAWQMADSAFELGIGIAALIGGVYGTRAVRFLKEARGKSKALKEIIGGNELFKRTCKDQAEPFKDAHRSQSPETRQIVAVMK